MAALLALRPVDPDARAMPWSQGLRSLSFRPAGAAEAPEAPHALGPALIFWADPDAAAVEPHAQMLRRSGFEVRRFDTLAELEAAMAAAQPSLVILDTAMPGEDALALCGRLSGEADTPVMLFSAAAETLDRVAGLESGADEYLHKAAHPLEVLARTRALLRRARRQVRTKSPGAWSLDMLTGLVTGPSGRCVRLSPSEATLLKLFSERPNEVLYRQELMALLHGEAAGGLTPRLVDTRVARLRKALDACDAGGDLIRTMRGGGYLFHAAVGG
ncbi:response regulator transcription factor [Phenylobacterium sp.]|uniref:response regulator transcription factor n=1 Tax=Phenylobacterium sp. TaxID=1871053 RepID=UPI002811A4C0|nr:response regulator transcription factor [Phenylobacterium sp.]